MAHPTISYEINYRDSLDIFNSFVQYLLDFHLATEESEFVKFKIFSMSNFGKRNLFPVLIRVINSP
ncbi:unnamed protein product [Heterobilharzia americana]|nr:unnamed protein product [Heterobilharzia americana]CAH8566738.1 unnamed protein product [Heterobilharzia americana]